MKLWVDGKENGSLGTAIQAKVKEQVQVVNRKVTSRGVRVVNALRNAQLEVLQGQRSGRVYKKPGTYGKRMSKSTKEMLGEYGHKLRGGQLYRASAPGEPPARRTGNLRLHWNGQVKSKNSSGGGISVVAELESGEKYAAVLESGTKDGKLKPRPFIEKIKEEAMPEIKKIYSEPYT